MPNPWPRERTDARETAGTDDQRGHAHAHAHGQDDEQEVEPCWSSCPSHLALSARLLSSVDGLFTLANGRRCYAAANDTWLAALMAVLRADRIEPAGQDHDHDHDDDARHHRCRSSLPPKKLFHLKSWLLGSTSDDELKEWLKSSWLSCCLEESLEALLSESDSASLLLEPHYVPGAFVRQEKNRVFLKTLARCIDQSDVDLLAVMAMENNIARSHVNQDSSRNVEWSSLKSVRRLSPVREDRPLAVAATKAKAKAKAIASARKPVLPSERSSIDSSTLGAFELKGARPKTSATTTTATAGAAGYDSGRNGHGWTNPTSKAAGPASASGCGCGGDGGSGDGDGDGDEELEQEFTRHVRNHEQSSCIHADADAPADADADTDADAKEEKRQPDNPPGHSHLPCHNTKTVADCRRLVNVPSSCDLTGDRRDGGDPDWFPCSSLSMSNNREQNCYMLHPNSEMEWSSDRSAWSSAGAGADANAGATSSLASLESGNFDSKTSPKYLSTRDLEKNHLSLSSEVLPAPKLSPVRGASATCSLSNFHRTQPRLSPSSPFSVVLPPWRRRTTTNSHRRSMSDPSIVNAMMGGPTADAADGDGDDDIDSVHGRRRGHGSPIAALLASTMSERSWRRQSTLPEFGRTGSGSRNGSEYKKNVEKELFRTLSDSDDSLIAPMPRPPTEGHALPRPASREQSLVSYISSVDTDRYQAQLDRENAHLILAEAVIQVANRANYEKKAKQDRAKRTTSALTAIAPSIDADADADVEADFARLQQHLQSQRQLETKVLKAARISPRVALFSEDEDDNMEEEWLENDEDDGDLELSADNDSVSINGSGDPGSPLNSSAAPELDPSNKLVDNSAESIALALLSNMKEPQQPKVQDVFWMVNDAEDDDATQRLLPLPPDEHSSSTSDPTCLSNQREVRPGGVGGVRGATELRGTENWAPPRAQLILQAHKKKKLEPAVCVQGFRCAGCGVHVKRQYMKTFRFCFYFGKYFCTSCHDGDQSILPAKIVHEWDFREFSVCTFALSVISSLSRDRLFHMEAINPNLVRRVVKLRSAIEWRKRAALTFPYILTCRTKEEDVGTRQLSGEISRFSLGQDVSSLTLNELCLVKMGRYSSQLKPIVERAIGHIRQCKHCHLHGHICEGCRSQDILFPFQFAEVSQCPSCGVCYHKPCYDNMLATQYECTKCRRLRERREQRLLKESASAAGDGDDVGGVGVGSGVGS